jgi:hypothetical protein
MIEDASVECGLNESVHRNCAARENRKSSYAGKVPRGMFK